VDSHEVGEGIVGEPESISLRSMEIQGYKSLWQCRKMNGTWKAQVIDFRFSGGNTAHRSMTSSPQLEAVLVRHAYTKSQIQVDPALSIHATSPCNYIFPLFDEDWVSPRSIVTLIVAMHYEIGEETRGARTHSEL
jgi:hypothetical protein